MGILPLLFSSFALLFLPFGGEAGVEVEVEVELALEFDEVELVEVELAGGAALVV